jgi:hypothetical protein
MQGPERRSGWGLLLWVLAAGGPGLGITAVFTGFFHLPRTLFVPLDAATAGTLVCSYFRWSDRVERLRRLRPSRRGLLHSDERWAGASVAALGALEKHRSVPLQETGVFRVQSQLHAVCQVQSGQQPAITFFTVSCRIPSA